MARLPSNSPSVEFALIPEAKGGHKRITTRLLLTVLIIFGPLLLKSTASESNGFRSRKHYILNLTLNEFSILNVSEMDGLIKYGGSGEFQLKIAKEESNVVWTVTVENP